MVVLVSLFSLEAGEDTESPFSLVKSRWCRFLANCGWLQRPRRGPVTCSQSSLLPVCLLTDGPAAASTGQPGTGAAGGSMGPVSPRLSGGPASLNPGHHRCLARHAWRAGGRSGMTKSLQMTRGGALLTRGEERLAGDPGHGGGVWGCSSSQGVGIAPSDWPLAWMGVSGSRDLELSQCSSCTPSLIVVVTSGRASEERMNQHHHRCFLLRLLLARDLRSKLAAATVPAACCLGVLRALY